MGDEGHADFHGAEASGVIHMLKLQEGHRLADPPEDVQGGPDPLGCVKEG